VVGDFNDWSPTDMHASVDGRGYEVTIELARHRAYRFRYLLDGVRWENDWQADSYVANEYGGDDSVIDLPPAPLDPSESHHPGRRAMEATRKRSPRRQPPAKTGSTETGAAANPSAATAN